MDRLQFDKYTASHDFGDIYINMALYADDVHRNVNQRYDDKPYFFHLQGVVMNTMKYLNEVCDDENDIVPVVFGAFFHDSIEDARLTYNDVMKIAKEYMNDEQAYLATEIVYALTNEKGRNRHERANLRYYQGIHECKYAPLVKAADRLANYNYAKSVHSKMEDCYKREMKEFVELALTENGVLLVPQAMVDELFS